MINLTEPEIAAFWRHVNRGGPDECWPCDLIISRRNRTPHLRYCCPSGDYVAHHLTYCLVIGPLPPNVRMWRLCGDERCVNPRHWSTTAKSQSMIPQLSHSKASFTRIDGTRIVPRIEFPHHIVRCCGCGWETIMRSTSGDHPALAGWRIVSAVEAYCDYCERKETRQSQPATRWRG